MSEITPELVFPVAWYDGPVEGLARLADGQMVWFLGDPHLGQWDLYRLNPGELAAELAAQRHFEQMVGTHWSFDVPRDERVQRPREHQQRYFHEQDRAADSARRGAYRHADRLIGVARRWAPARG